MMIYLSEAVCCSGSDSTSKMDERGRRNDRRANREIRSATFRIDRSRPKIGRETPRVARVTRANLRERIVLELHKSSAAGA